ncbi:DUF2076 domain-containing protein [Rhizobium sp.]
MSPDERHMLDDLFDRVQGAAATQRDPEAEELIAQRLREQPYATYYLAQAVIIQDQALKATTDRIQELEAQVRDLEDQTRHMPEPQNTGFLGGLSNLFGGGQQQQRPVQVQSRGTSGTLYDDYQRANTAQPVQAGQPGTADNSPWGRTATAPAAGPWSRAAAPGGGGSFLQGAMSTAAGVAGGMLMANAVQGLFAGDATKTAANPAATPPAENTAEADKAKEEPQQETAQADDENDGGFDIFGGGDDDDFA